MGGGGGIFPVASLYTIGGGGGMLPVFSSYTIGGGGGIFPVAALYITGMPIPMGWYKKGVPPYSVG